MRGEYRIIRDTHAGYAVQVRRWWWPFWMETGFLGNTHASIEDAERHAARHALGSANLVRSLGVLPRPEEREKTE